MRIITGLYKSRVLKAPKDIRPTEDRVRKALFDILGDVSGLSFLDLFAGSGSVGFEALSLGAEEVVFVESQRHSIQVIEENIKKLGCGDRAKVINQDVFRAIRNIAQKGSKFDTFGGVQTPPFRAGKEYAVLSINPEQTPRFSAGCRRIDLIFLDPPYYQGIAEKTLQILGGYDILHNSGFAVVQHYKKDFVPEKAGNLALWRQERYGDSLLSFYRLEKAIG